MTHVLQRSEVKYLCAGEPTKTGTGQSFIMPPRKKGGRGRSPAKAARAASPASPATKPKPKRQRARQKATVSSGKETAPLPKPLPKHVSLLKEGDDDSRGPPTPASVQGKYVL